MYPKYYKLDKNNNPIPCTLDEFANMYSDKNFVLAQNKIKDSLVSTVFLGLDHNYGDNGLPILWETMIFPDSGGDNYQVRYSSYKEAIEGHLKACLTIDPDFKLMEFPEVGLVKIYEEAKEKYSKNIREIKRLRI